jgi:hypothetical protein
MQHKLESGHTVEMRPVKGPGGLRAKDKDIYEASIKLYVTFAEDGTPDMSKIPFSMSLERIRRDALIARVVKGWSFVTDDGAPLPVPYWEADEIHNGESIGEIELDDFDELMTLMAPYVAKVQRTPDPKGTTTASSNGTSMEKVGTSPRGSTKTS